jgi:toxin ParE1/3/4
VAQIVWTESALLDLDGIVEYIALDKYTAAEALVEDIFSRVEHLKKFPDSGRKPPELLRKFRYRELIVGPCRIFYRTDESKIYVLYVMRSEKLLRKYILSDRDSSGS